MTETVAAWSGVRLPAVAGSSAASRTLIRAVSACSTRAWVRQVPKPVPEGMTQSPRWRVETPGPRETTSKQPSLPGRADGSEVPIRLEKEGLAP